MTREELITNLGTVAHSGTFKFFDAVANGSMDADLIGQFGVGLYSSYLVASKIEVTSKRYNSTQNIWTSLETSSYTVREDKKGEDLKRGTKVKLFLKEKEAQYSNTTRVKDIIMKYSQFIDFNIFYELNKRINHTDHTVMMKIIQNLILIMLSQFTAMSMLILNQQFGFRSKFRNC